MKYRTEKWSRCFFTSFFTHPNIHETNGLTTHEGGIFELWRALMAGQKFSNQALVPAGETLEQAFKRVLES